MHKAIIIVINIGEVVDHHCLNVFHKYILNTLCAKVLFLSPVIVANKVLPFIIMIKADFYNELNICMFHKEK